MMTLSKYKYLIFDVDDTLLNFYSAFQKAQEDMAKKLGIKYSDEYRQFDDKCGWKAWKESGLENTKAKNIQENYHIYYYEYIRKHYLYLAQQLGLKIKEDELVDYYIESISASKVSMEPETLRVYKTLANSYELILATNGISSIQRARILDFIPFTYKIYISEEVGSIKPSKAYFDSIIHDLGCEAKECLMIGDSIDNDIMGAKEVGMDVCYYNIKKKEKQKDLDINYEIHSITELIKILL